MPHANLSNVPMVFRPDGESVSVDLERTSWIVNGLCSSLHHKQLLTALRPASERVDHFNDVSGFRFAGEASLDKGEELWEGVELTMLDGVEHIPEPDFARLTLRVAQTFIAGANERDHPMLREPWWPELLDATKRLEDMVAALDDGGAAER